MIDNGSLCDVAPSMLYLMNMPIPPEMTGTPLVELLPASADQTEPPGKVEVHG
jgi:2,3-bisphosphoglycerate-independent phosphoglycerate mutase